MNDSHQEIAAIHETELEGPARPKEKKIIHFSSGQTLEVEYSEEEEEEEKEEASTKRSPFQEPSERTGFSFRKVAFLMGRISLLACDCLGGRLAGALGLNAAKYQYAIDEYHRNHKRTHNGTTQGPTQPTHLSPRVAGSRYGATGNTSGPTAPHESCKEKLQDGKEGRHNRGYREDEDYVK